MITITKAQVRQLMANHDLPRIKRASLKPYVHHVNYGNAETAVVPASYAEYL